MKISKLGLLLLAAILFFGSFSARTAKADPAVSFDFFYNSLEPYGEWVDMPEYGLCWHPSNVDEDWAPYMDGYWANTDAGWTWVSYEDWGGITYHYGRWAKIPDEGWFWVPDYEWAPAWVSWRSSDDYVGWAPLPPTARWQPSIGFSFWVDSYCDIGPTYYNFCPVRFFGNPALRHVIIDRRQNITIINRTTNITNITINKSTNIIYNGGPSYAMMARKSIKPIQTLKLRQQSDLADFRQSHGPIMAHQRGNELVVVAPRVEAPGSKFKPTRVTRVLPPKPIDTGWAGISDPRNELHSKIKAEAKNVTPEKAPALPPAPRDIQSFEQRLKSQPAQPTAGTVQPLPGQNPPGAGKHGKHDKLAPFITPAPQQPMQIAQPTPSTVEPGKASTQQGGSFPPAGVSPRDQQRQALEERKQQAREEQLQRKQKASEEQALRAQQQQQQQAQEKAMRKEQEKQAARMQQAQRDQEMQQHLRDQQQRSQEQQLRAQDAQQRRAEQQQKAQREQEIQLQRSQEQQIRAQEAQQRRVEQQQKAQREQEIQLQRSQEQQIRAQEAQQRRAEQQQRAQEFNVRREIERESKHQIQPQIQVPKSAPQQVQPQTQTPAPSKGEGKHGKDRDSDR
jgi:hypothetical protein